MKRTSLFIAATVLLILPQIAFAADMVTYHDCKNQDGSMSYRIYPCDKEQSEAHKFDVDLDELARVGSEKSFVGLFSYQPIPKTGFYLCKSRINPDNTFGLWEPCLPGQQIGGKRYESSGTSVVTKVATGTTNASSGSIEAFCREAFGEYWQGVEECIRGQTAAKQRIGH